MMTDKRPFFFLHIPKTAGLTMQAPLATLALLCYKRGWPFPDEIQARNVNDARPRRTVLASSTLNRLADINAIDIALYELARQKFSADFHRMISLLVTAHAARTPLKRLIALVNG